MDASDDEEEDPSADAMDTTASASLVELKAPAAKKGGAQVGLSDEYCVWEACGWRHGSSRAHQSV